MIIRSQNKKKITDDLKLHIRIVEYNSTDDMYEIRDSSGNTIGEYSTMEKAVKVLDMIQEMYEKNLYSEGGLMATANFYVPPFAFVPPKIFQMPEDSEV